MATLKDLEKENVSRIIWLHGLIILLIWLSPFLFRWPIIIIGIIVYYLQLIIFGDCILTLKQFNVKRRSVTFYYYILVKMGFKLNMYHVRFIADYIMPWIILGITLLWQIIFNIQPVLY